MRDERRGERYRVCTLKYRFEEDVQVTFERCSEVGGLFLCFFVSLFCIS